MTKIYQDAYDKWMKPHERDEDMPMYPEAFEAGWKSCKKEVLKMLKENWTGLDMSINSCDEHYVEKVKRL